MPWQQPPAAIAVPPCSPGSSGSGMRRVRQGGPPGPARARRDRTSCVFTLPPHPAAHVAGRGTLTILPTGGVGGGRGGSGDAAGARDRGKEGVGVPQGLLVRRPGSCRQCGCGDPRGRQQRRPLPLLPWRRRRRQASATAAATNGNKEERTERAPPVPTPSVREGAAATACSATACLTFPRPPPAMDLPSGKY